MKKNSKKIVLSIILALILVIAFATTSFASYSSTFLDLYQYYATTGAKGNMSYTDKGGGRGYNDISSVSDITMWVCASDNILSQGVQAVRYLSPNDPTTVKLSGWHFYKVNLYNPARDASMAIGYVDYNLQ